MDSKKLTGLLTQHGEKLVLGLFVLVAAFLLYSGLSMPDYTQEQKPDDLQQLAQNVKRSIDDEHWSALREERTIEVEFEERVDKAQKPIPTAPYATDTPWEWRGKPQGARREDPELAPPSKPHMVGVLGAIAIQHATERTYPLAELEDAEPLDAEEQPTRGRRRRSRRGGGPEGMGEAGMGEAGMMEPGMMPGEGYAGLEGYPGMAGAGANLARRRVDRQYNLGFDATKLSPQAMVERVTPETAHFIAGTALVPHSKFIEAYDLAFENAKGRNPRRDTPVYWEFEVQRADVTDKPVDQLTDADWKLVFTFSQFEKQFKRWAGTAADIVPQKYSDGQLTMPLPPLMLRDLQQFAVHPDLPIEDPRMRNAGFAGGPLAGQPEMGIGEDEEGLEEEEERPGMMGPPGFAGGPPSFGGGPRGGRNGYGPGMMGGAEMGMGMGMPGMEGYGGRGQSGFGPPEHKLVRFYDFVDQRNPNSPQVGRKYVYRVHVAVEDPNFPRIPALQPPLRFLSPDAYARVSQKIEQAEADPSKRDPRLWTDWSEPSDPVSLPDLVRVYAGPVEPADVVEARRPQPVQYQRRPPQAELVALQWDRKLATDLIVPIEARPGSVLAKSDEANVIDPINLSIRKTEQRQLDTGSVVLDVIGGHPLELADDPKITEPGMVLMFDQSGNLQVLDEIEQMQPYRLYSFADEREAAEAAAERRNNQENMGPDMMLEEPGMMPGGEGGGRGRGRGRGRR